MNLHTLNNNNKKEDLTLDLLDCNEKLITFFYLILSMERMVKLTI